MQNKLKKLNISEFEYSQILKRLKREPKELELYLFSAIWSEHCGYKHTKELIKKFPKKNGFMTDENAGGVVIGNTFICFKVESHNHPSAVEPYNGAATGVGGIIRDIIATGSRPIALLNSLKFGSPSTKKTKHIVEGVVRGISSYGNCIGVPTIGGETYFDTAYENSPLVNVMAVGISAKDKIVKSGVPAGCSIVLVGSDTSIDGLHGASFASKKLKEETSQDRPSVQIADAFTGKLLIDATLEIIDDKNTLACQDCGAAGILSSTSEMAYKGNCAIELNLDKVHTSMELDAYQIMLSETQERMVFAIKGTNFYHVDKICKKYGLTYSIIGQTLKGNEYNLYYKGEKVASLPVKLLSEPPLYKLKEIKSSKTLCNRPFTDTDNLDINIKKFLKNPNIVSKKYIYSSYDSTVGTRTLTKPQNIGASILYLKEEDCYISVNMDSNPLEVAIDSYKGTYNSIFEGYRNAVAMGFEPLGLTNCLNFGSPTNEKVASDITKCAKAITQACKTIGVPVVSGNASLFNETDMGNITPTPVFGIVGSCKSIDNIILPELEVKNTLFIIGNQLNSKSKIGGRLYFKEFYPDFSDDIEISNSKLEFQLAKIIKLLKTQKILKCSNDVSKGGMFVSLFECLRAANLGFEFEQKFDEKDLFAQIPSRYIIGVNDEIETISVLNSMKIPFTILGKTTNDVIRLNNIEFRADELFEIYDNSLKEALE